ncbi:MAG TPA: ankyrin repeat domain-containing protein [Candidatus Polarisedimenticolia bacterium]|jgi:ankyrin repeat protein|nr:ankyrin repeat domain-containing protein [Candidatus Polarisedimenticolia bacterium]
MRPEEEIFVAVERGNTARVDALLEADANLVHARNERGDSPLLTAVYTGRKDLFDRLLARGAGVSLHEAAALGHVDRVRQHLDADPRSVSSHSHDGWTALHLAAFFGHRELAAVLLDRGADVNARSTSERFAQSNTPLHAAAANRQVEVARLLVERGADVNAKDGHGFTPLALAANSKSDLLMLLLLEQGARAE